MQVAQHKQTSAHYWSEKKVSERANSPVEGIYIVHLYISYYCILDLSSNRFSDNTNTESVLHQMH